MNTVAVFSGAGHRGISGWALQARHDSSILQVAYRTDYLTIPFFPILDQYGAHAFDFIFRNPDRPVEWPLDLIGVSMGFLAALGAAERAEREAPGIIRSVNGVNPGVFGGPLPVAEALELWKNYGRIKCLPNPEVESQEERALSVLRETIPGFECKTTEYPLAMAEAVSGVIPLPPNLEPKINIFRSSHDELLPKSLVTLLAARAGVEVVDIPDKPEFWYHNTPLLDTEGWVLEFIREYVERQARGKRRANLTSAA